MAGFPDPVLFMMISASWCYFPERWLQLATAIGLLAWTCGCTPRAGRLEIDQSIQARALLVSEILAAEDRVQLVDCPIRIVNRSAQERTVTLVATGCSCYGVSVDGLPLQNGDTVTIAAGATRTLKINARPTDMPSEKEYSVQLSSASAEGQEEVVTSRCRLRVFQDLRLTPNVLTIDAPRGAAVDETRTVLIEHVSRGNRSAAGPPTFVDLPPGIQVQELVEASPPEELGDGLVRRSWQGTLRISLPAEREQTSNPFPLIVVMRNSQGSLQAKGEGSLILHTRTPIAFPTRVHFGNLVPGEPRQRRILVTSTNGTPFSIHSDPDRHPSFLQVELDERPAAQHWLQLTVTPPQPGTFSETLTLQTDCPEEPEISIQLEGHVDASGGEK